jgi:WD40 repeat protein
MTNGNLAYKLLEETPNEGTLDFSPDGSRVATIAGGSVQLRSVVDGSLLSSTPIEGYPFDVFEMRFSPDGRKLALSGGTGIDIWDLPEKQGAELAYQGWIKIARYGPGIVPYPYKIAFHPEKNSLLVLSEEGLQTFSLASLASTGTIEIPAYPWDFDISPSGEWVAIGTTGGLEVLSYPAGKRIFNESCDGQVEGVLFSPDGSTLLVSVAPIDSSDADYYLYNSQDWSVLKRIPGTVELGLLQNYSPDGQLLATADGQTIILRRASDAVGLTELKGHSEIVTDLAFSPDGTLMASTGLDGTICIWGIP